MAAIFVCPSPSSPNTATAPSPSFAMSHRRPLSTIQNGPNSPVVQGISKRARPAGVQSENIYAQPPSKKQAVERDEKSPRKSAVVTGGNEGKVFTKRNPNAPVSSFEKKLVASCEKAVNADRVLTNLASKPAAAEKERKARIEKSAESLESIRQWQRHYRKVFPQFVFYFESLPEDVRHKFSKQIAALGATEEKFFSKTVTHVVTARPIPPETDAPTTEATANDEAQTVNPQILHPNTNGPIWQSFAQQQKSTEMKKTNADVLHRARQMGMKIWALEKLQRVLSTINDTNTHGHYTRSNVAAAKTRGRAEDDLSLALEHDRLNGIVDRDPAKELHLFYGPFIYVHDATERTRPVMQRQYANRAKREDGFWPQFRSAPLGKCPFIDDPVSRRELEHERAEFERRDEEKKEKTKVAAAYKQAAAPTLKPMHPPESAAPKKVEDIQPRPNTVDTESTFQPCPALPDKPVDRVSSNKMNFKSAHEPIASGIQASNVTSAIRSQMVSSNPAAPGAKAATSKEVHELKKKVLEKSNGLSTTSGIPSSYRTVDAAAAQQAASRAPAARAAKTKAEERLAAQPQNMRRRTVSAADDAKKGEKRKREPKPGYCENCRDKFDDFEEHAASRRHRKFAMTTENWKDLDRVLARIHSASYQNHPSTWPSSDDDFEYF